MRKLWIRAAAILLAALILAPGPARGEEASPLQAEAEAAFNSQDWERAAELYGEITKAEPDNGVAWFRMGLSYRLLGRTKEALESYVRAEKEGFTSVQLLASAGMCEAILGHDDKALGYLERAVDQGLPPQFLETQKDLAGLRKNPGFEALLAQARLKANPCENDPKYHAFDFWVGDWDVTMQGNVVGHNRIEKILGGCLLVENWTSASGVSGKSFNYLDPSTGTWKQNWVSQNGTIVWYEGTVKDGAMHYAGENISADGSKKMTRVTLEPISEGRVHHVIETSSDGGKSWTSAFDAVYVLKSEKTGSGE